MPDPVEIDVNAPSGAAGEVAIETPPAANAETPPKEPVAEEGKEATEQVERTFTQKEHQDALEARLAKERAIQQRKYERRLEQEVDHWRTAAARPADSQQTEQTNSRPEREGFASDIEYVRAEAKWEAERTFDSRFQQITQAQRHTQEAAYAEKAMTEHKARLDKAIDKYPDYEDVAFNPTLRITTPMSDAMILSEHGTEIGYYFGKNPDVAAKIAAMPPALALMELGKIEAKFATPDAKKLSNAPPPIKPVQNGNTVTKNLESASMDEYKKLRKSQGARWAN